MSSIEIFSEDSSDSLEIMREVDNEKYIVKTINLTSYELTSESSDDPCKAPVENPNNSCITVFKGTLNSKDSESIATEYEKTLQNNKCDVLMHAREFEGNKSEETLTFSTEIKNISQVPPQSILFDTGKVIDNRSSECGETLTDNIVADALSNDVANKSEEPSSSTEIQSGSEIPPESTCIFLDSGRKPVEGNSSEAESDSSSSSASSIDIERPEVTKRQSFKDKEFQNNQNKNVSKAKTQGELDLDDLPPIENLYITVPENDIHLIGKVSSIVESLVIIQSFDNEPVLDLDSVLFKKNGESFGKVFDVFGRVTAPYYAVRFNSKEDIQKLEIKIWDEVFSAPDHSDVTSFVIPEQLMKLKGSDASWKDNNEPPVECLEFSDDEEERNHKLKLRAKRKGETGKNDDTIPYTPSSTDEASATNTNRNILWPPRTFGNKRYTKRKAPSQANGGNQNIQTFDCNNSFYNANYSLPNQLNYQRQQPTAFSNVQWTNQSYLFGCNQYNSMPVREPTGTSLISGFQPKGPHAGAPFSAAGGHPNSSFPNKTFQPMCNFQHSFPPPIPEHNSSMGNRLYTSLQDHRIESLGNTSRPNQNLGQASDRNESVQSASGQQPANLQLHQLFSQPPPPPPSI